MRSLFEPKSIAIIGASGTPGKIGHTLLKNLKTFGFKGQIYPVNPKRKTLQGKKVYPTVKALPKSVDLAIIAIPATLVTTELENLGKKGIKNIIIISAGFKEIGPEGAKREAEIKAIDQKYKLNIIGPNCLGILNPHHKLNASFAGGLPEAGNIALISQSGAMAVAIMDWAEKSDLGFSKIVSLGNKTDIDSVELLHFLKNDPQTKVILLYLEDFENGPEFLHQAQAIIPHKPIILLKSGRSHAGQKAASSHTGALAGSDTAVDAACTQAGIIRVTTIEELFDYASIFSVHQTLNNNHIAIITNAGGPGIITTDSIAQSNLTLATFSKETLKKLKQKLPPAASIENPIDVIGDALADRYQSALELVIKDKNVDAVLVLLTPQIMTESLSTASLIKKIQDKHRKKPIITSFIGKAKVKAARDFLGKNHIPHYNFPENAVKSISQLWQYSQNKKRKGSTKTQSPQNKKVKLIREEVQKHLSKNAQTLPFSLTQKILHAYHLPHPKEAIAQNTKDAIRLAKTIGYPVVAKIIAPEIIHKTDIGGIHINIKNKKELQSACQNIWERAKKHHPKAHIEGILIQKMLPLGREVIIGIKRDPVFGPLLAFGLGGIYVNIFEDVTFRIAPITFLEAEKMITEIKAIKLLQGVRGEKAVDIESLAHILVKTSHLAADLPEITELDFNPVLAFEKESFVADAKFIARKQE